MKDEWEELDELEHTLSTYQCEQESVLILQHYSEPLNFKPNFLVYHQKHIVLISPRYSLDEFLYSNFCSNFPLDKDVKEYKLLVIFLQILLFVAQQELPA